AATPGSGRASNRSLLPLSPAQAATALVAAVARPRGGRGAERPLRLRRRRRQTALLRRQSCRGRKQVPPFTAPVPLPAASFFAAPARTVGGPRPLVASLESEHQAWPSGWRQYGMAKIERK